MAAGRWAEKAGEILQDVGAVGIAVGVAMVFVIPGAFLIGLGGRMLVAALARRGEVSNAPSE